MVPCQSEGLKPSTLHARSISRPFVSLTQDAKTAEKNKNRVKNKDILLLKQRHFTAEGAEDAEESMFLVYKQDHSMIVNNKQKISSAYPATSAVR